MVDSRPTPPRCPECGSFVATDSDTCKRCGALLDRRRWPSALTTGLETLLVVAILGSLIGAIWLMRPAERPAGSPGPGPRPTPTPLPTSTATFTRTPTPTSTATPTITPTPTPSFYIHTVAAGDTLIAIALEYGVPLDAILEANDIDENDLLSVGQELIVPLGAEVELPTATATRLPSTGFNVITHTVRAGDTLLGIANRYNTAVSDIVEANGLPSPDVILNIGDVLTIPVDAPSPTPVPPTFTPTTSPTHTLVPSPTPAGPTPTPQFALPAPALLAPPDNALLQGDTALLNWVSVGILSDDTWYVVRLRTAWPGEPEVTHEGWVKSTAWRVPEDLAPAPGTTQRYRWDVTVVRRVEGPTDEALSPRSGIRTFRWRR